MSLQITWTPEEADAIEKIFDCIHEELDDFEYTGDYTYETYEKIKKLISDTLLQVALDNCPFCGADEDTMHVEENDSNAFFVVCENCEVEGPPMRSKSAARSAWNRRVSSRKKSKSDKK